jgi:hypothetical protein
MGYKSFKNIAQNKNLYDKCFHKHLIIKHLRKNDICYFIDDNIFRSYVCLYVYYTSEDVVKKFSKNFYENFESYNMFQHIISNRKDLITMFYYLNGLNKKIVIVKICE